MAKAGTSQVRPFIILYGEEDYFLDQEMARVQTWSGRDVTSLDGSLSDASKVLAQECSSCLFDGPLRVVVVDEAQKIKGPAIKRYVEDKDPSDTSLVLVAVIRADKLPEVWATAASKGHVKNFPKLRTWDNNNEVIRWIGTEAARLKVILSKDLAAFLYHAVGSDLYRLASEIRKLALLVPDGEVTKEHVQMVLVATPTAEPWQVAEAVVDKDVRKAMNLLSTLYKNQGEEVHVPLVSALMKQTERLIIARQMLDRGQSAEEIAAMVEMSPKRVQYFYMPKVQKHKLPDLLGYMPRLCQLDADVKGSARSKRILVEMTVLALAS